MCADWECLVATVTYGVYLDPILSYVADLISLILPSCSTWVKCLANIAARATYCAWINFIGMHTTCTYNIIIKSVDSISRDGPDMHNSYKTKTLITQSNLKHF